MIRPATINDLDALVDLEKRSFMGDEISRRSFRYLLTKAHATTLADEDSGRIRGYVMLLFSNPYFALAGWVHYLVFDLFIGAWQVRDARRRGIPHLYVLPCLFLTLMAGPIGLLAYITLRFGMRRAVEFEETGPGSV